MVMEDGSAENSLIDLNMDLTSRTDTTRKLHSSSPPWYEEDIVIPRSSAVYAARCVEVTYRYLTRFWGEVGEVNRPFGQQDIRPLEHHSRHHTHPPPDPSMPEGVLHRDGMGGVEGLAAPAELLAPHSVVDHTQPPRELHGLRGASVCVRSEAVWTVYTMWSSRVVGLNGACSGGDAEHTGSGRLTQMPRRSPSGP